MLQNDFGPPSEEHFFQIKREKGILIQESGPSDSKIARFWRSDEGPTTFATESAKSRLPAPQGVTRALVARFSQMSPLHAQEANQ